MSLLPVGRTACLAASLLATCSGPYGASDDRLPDGSWGGEHISMEVTAARTSVEFDCARGVIEGPIALDKEGRFEAAGAYIVEHAGPVRDEDEKGRRVRYTGRVTGSTLTLSIAFVDGGDPMGPFALTRDRAGNVRKCR